MKNIILGAGIAGIGAAYELKKNDIDSIILEKNNSWGGLLDNFKIDGFRFDKFVHFSFAKEDYVNNIFFKTPLIKHKPISYNYYKGAWLKHPAQNNLYHLSKEEQKLILKDFKDRKELDTDNINNYEECINQHLKKLKMDVNQTLHQIHITQKKCVIRKKVDISLF